MLYRDKSGFCLTARGQVECCRGGAGGSSGGANCPNPPSGPVDPNDKLAESNLTCEYGTVVVDGEEQTRCVRYFLPLEQTDAPLYYTVTFENDPEATADAEFVTITDEIDPNLDLATLAIESTSSASTFSYTVEGRTVVTMESLKPNAARIPNICEHFGVRCMDLEEFMEAEGWKF